MLPIRMADPYESSAALNTRPHGTHDDLVHEMKSAYFERQPAGFDKYFVIATQYFIIDHYCIP